ncbi:hypothetical protein MASR2M78_00770 [Treponema sp.]
MKETEDENVDREDLVFHYSRSARLERASEAVRRLNDTTPRKKPNLLSSLAATKPLAFLFLAIIMLSATALVTSLLLPSDNEGELGNNKLTVSAFRYEGSTYLALKKQAGKKNVYTGPVQMAIAAEGSSANPEIQTIVFKEAPKEEFRRALSFEADTILVLLQMGDQRRSLKARVE